MKLTSLVIIVLLFVPTVTWAKPDLITGPIAGKVLSVYDGKGKRKSWCGQDT